MIQRTLKLGLFSAVLLLATSAPSHAGYQFITIDVPGSKNTDLYSINNSGQIVGRFDDKDGVHGFLYDAGAITPIDVPGALGTQTTGINNSGQIVGLFNDKLGEHGFIYSAGSFTKFDVPGAAYTLAFGVND